MTGSTELMDVDQTDANGSGRSAESTPNGTTNANLRLKALTQLQERRLNEYLDERWLEFTRNFKKRSERSSKLPTLSRYLEESRHLLAFILQIPPIDPSTSLRITYMLRLTGDVLGSIPGYSLTRRVSNPLAPQPSENERPIFTPQDIRATLRDLLDFLDDLDQAWLAVLQGQVWDPSSAEGIDLDQAVQSILHAPNGTNGNGAHSSIPTPNEVRTSPPTQTDITRLRSLLVGGESALEEWLINEQVSKLAGGSALGTGTGLVDDNDDLAGMLDQMDLLDEFDNLFIRSMGHLGFRDIKPEDLGRGEEVPMSAPVGDEQL